MNKLSFLLAFLLAIILIACNKDDEAPDNNAGTPALIATFSNSQVTSASGIATVDGRNYVQLIFKDFEPTNDCWANINPTDSLMMGYAQGAQLTGLQHLGSYSQAIPLKMGWPSGPVYPSIFIERFDDVGGVVEGYVVREFSLINECSGERMDYGEGTVTFRCERVQ